VTSQVPDPGLPERRRRRAGHPDDEPSWPAPEGADYPEPAGTENDPFPQKEEYFGNATATGDPRYAAPPTSGRHARPRDQGGYAPPPDQGYPEPRQRDQAHYPEPRRAAWPGNEPEVGGYGGRAPSYYPDQPPSGRAYPGEPGPQRYPDQERTAAYRAEPGYRQDLPPARGYPADPYAQEGRRRRARRDDAPPPQGYYPPDGQRPSGYPPAADPRRNPGDAPPLWDHRAARGRSPEPAQRWDAEEAAQQRAADGRPHEAAQRPPRTGYPPAEPGDGDRYLGMSDPASRPRRRPPNPAESSSAWGPPGQPAFMGYAEQAYGGPYPEPPTLAMPALWRTPAPVADAAPATTGQAETAEPVTGTFTILKSSSVMAVGTLASRLTGFVRTLIQAWALGLFTVSVAYNTANTLPNVVYNLALGGILTSVIVPLIVNATKRDRDRGAAYEQRMFTLITVALVGITVVATLAAAPLVGLYKGNIHGPQLHLMVIFAYFFIPQIFFYGMSSLISAVLNTRNSFAAPMWTPVVNNVVVIAVLLLFMVTAGPLKIREHHISGSEVLLVGLGTTLGIVAQTVALVPSLRKVGFRWQPRWDFRRTEAAEIGRMGGWMFCYIAATQVAFLVTTIAANSAAPKTGVTAYTYAWQLFQLPYAVVGISVITAILPRMSGHASEGRLGLVRSDFSAGVRLASVIVVPSSLVLAALGPPMGLLFFGPGSTGGPQQARYIGVVFAVFCLGLLPFMLFQLQLRVFYSLHDSKTPALIGLATMSVNIVANLIALHSLPQHEVVAGLGVGFGLANLLGTVLAWRILSRRLRGLDGRAIGGALTKMYAAAIPAALFAVLVGVIAGDSHITAAAITIVVGGGGALGLYVMFARAMGVRELTRLSGMVRGRIGR
jgi:putative peptidoglycan lipid II flippase